MAWQGRVVQLDRGYPLVRTDDGRTVRCKHAVALVKGRKMRAVVGDYVVVEAEEDADVAQIVDICERRNQLVRRDPAERSQSQVLAANFDTVFVVCPVGDLNMRRLERELVLAHETGADVAVVLTKADLVDEGEAARVRESVEQIVAGGVDVVLVSDKDPESIEKLRTFIPAESVGVLIGKSGVGKSSLVNLLTGSQVQPTTPVRETDGKGRHTTVNRAMIPIEGGGLVVDMPGVRGLGLWESEHGIAAAFPDVDELAAQCRFRDCKHLNEPGCAVLEAVEQGTLPAARLESFRRLMDENRQQHESNEEAQRIRSRTGHPRNRPKRKGRTAAEDDGADAAMDDEQDEGSDEEESFA